MEATFLIQLVLILFAARMLGEIAAYFRIPIVLGELLAGVILGPSLLGIVDNTPTIQLLAQIGVILLLFEVGLETNIGRLAAASGKALLVAITGVALPFLLGFCGSYYLFHFSLLVSLFIGSTLTATSIGVTLRVLRDLKKQNTHESHIVIGAAVFDDIIGIILLSVLYEFSLSGAINLWNTARILVFIALFFILSPFVARGISQTIKKWDEKSVIPGLLPTMVISLIMLFAWISHEIGAPELLGGFAAGLALSRQFFTPFGSLLHQSPAFTKRVEKEMNPIIHLFSPIFFVAIGLSLNLQLLKGESMLIWSLAGVLLLAAVLGKFLTGFFLREKLKSQLIVGTAMIPRGEVGLIFANVGLTSGVFTSDIYAAMILVIAMTTLLAPSFLRIYYKD
ncbi:MAG: cation:proton antiporter [Verrucomicrobia bacterium]|nr:cation:proton antiporter [Verrucomicrobiota bacterium]